MLPKQNLRCKIVKIWDPKLTNFYKGMFAGRGRGKSWPLADISLSQLEMKLRLLIKFGMIKQTVNLMLNSEKGDTG